MRLSRRLARFAFHRALAHGEGVAYDGLDFASKTLSESIQTSGDCLTLPGEPAAKFVRFDSALPIRDGDLGMFAPLDGSPRQMKRRLVVNGDDWIANRDIAIRMSIANLEPLGRVVMEIRGRALRPQNIEQIDALLRALPKSRDFVVFPRPLVALDEMRQAISQHLKENLQ